MLWVCYTVDLTLRGLSYADKQTLHEEDSWRLVQGNRRAATRCDKTARR
jgi:hypothetical protein